LHSGKAYVVVFGEIYYDDVFGTKQHWTHFAYGIPQYRDYSAPECAEYNSVDNN